MTLDEAVAVLNERRHDDYAKWYTHAFPGGSSGSVGIDNYLTEFEAIAVAEKYLRDEPRTTSPITATIPTDAVWSLDESRPPNFGLILERPGQRRQRAAVIGGSDWFGSTPEECREVAEFILEAVKRLQAEQSKDHPA